LRSLITLAAIWLAAVAATSDEPASISDLEVILDGEVYVASARLQGGLTAERIEEIDAGLEITISYRLNVYRERSGLPNPAVSKQRIECTVQHDALTRQYTLTRRIDGELQEKKVTPDDAQMREFMTVLDRLPVATVEEILPGESYYIKARSDLGLVWRFYMIPWRDRTPWMQVPIEVREDHGREVSGDDAAP
jgi:hypothetical protein